MKNRTPKRFCSQRALLCIGLLLGALSILIIRFFAYSPEHVHYHANFAVYINGVHEEFAAPQYYQEVAICSSAHGITIPEQRAHMHEKVNSLIHIHDHAATWGQFFENLGWYIGPDFIQTDAGKRYAADDTNKLNIIIDGQDYTDLTPLTNIIIKDKSRVLISYGPTDPKVLNLQADSIPQTAAKFDISKDPASCSGHEKVTNSDRLQHVFR